MPSGPLAGAARRLYHMGTMRRDAVVPWGAPRLVAVADLRFDRRSPRLHDVPATDSEDQVLARLWRESALDGLAASIAVNGFFADEPVIVEEDAAGMVVLDGNRRLAALRVLTDRSARERLRADDLPPLLSAAGLERLRQVPALVGRRDAVWPSMGYRHVAGPQPWRSHERAIYVAWVHEQLGVPLDQVARSLGDGEAGVRSVYRALLVLRAAETGGVFRLEDRWTSHVPFSLLAAALDREGVRAFIGLSSAGPAELRLPELGDLCAWLFGRRSSGLAPAVSVHEPDLDLLDVVVRSPGGLDALRHGESLAVAHASSQDGRRRLHDSVLAARSLLQEARGTALDRVPQQTDLLRAVDDLVGLAQSIRAEIEGGDNPGPHAPITGP